MARLSSKITFSGQIITNRKHQIARITPPPLSRFWTPKYDELSGNNETRMKIHFEAL
jgi:hypothetical protein